MTRQGGVGLGIPREPSYKLGMGLSLARGIWTELIDSLGSVELELRHCSLSRGTLGVVCPFLIGPSLRVEASQLSL